MEKAEKLKSDVNTAPASSNRHFPAALDIDFARLAAQDKDFAKIYNDNGTRLDFQDSLALQQLTKSVLRVEFGLSLKLPDDRLCPPVPIRYEYVRWMQDIIDTTCKEYTTEYDPARDVRGIDIGIGASCIYPLLACVTRSRWRMAGTDIDTKNLSFAKQNIKLNHFEQRIQLLLTKPNGPILDLEGLGLAHADFTMCNPPFFVSIDDMCATYSKERPPSAVCTGAEVEMITEGGDLGFALRMLSESMQLKRRVQWFSCMLGKRQSVGQLVARLRVVGVENWAVTCLRAGHITRRWAVAWSFDGYRPRNDIARADPSMNNVLPFPTDFRIQCTQPDHRNSTAVESAVSDLLRPLDLRLDWDDSNHSGICTATRNVWSRSARRRKANVPTGLSAPPEHVQSSDTNREPALVVRVSISPNSSASILDSNAMPVVSVRWLFGADTVIYESFCGMLKRALTSTN